MQGRAGSRSYGIQVSKWGNNLAIRLPAAIVEALDLHEGDDIEINIAGARSFAVARKPVLADQLKSLRRFRGRLPRDFKFARDEAHER